MSPHWACTISKLGLDSPSTPYPRLILGRTPVSQPVQPLCSTCLFLPSARRFGSGLVAGEQAAGGGLLLNILAYLDACTGRCGTSSAPSILKHGLGTLRTHTVGYGLRIISCRHCGHCDVLGYLVLACRSVHALEQQIIGGRRETERQGGRAMMAGSLGLGSSALVPQCALPHPQ